MAAQMAKIIGIVSLILLFTSFLAPLFGVYITFAALLIAAIAASMGERPFVIATAVAASAKLFFMSPIWTFAMYSNYDKWGNPGGGLYGYLLITILFLLLPVTAIVLRNAYQHRK